MLALERAVENRCLERIISERAQHPKFEKQMEKFVAKDDMLRGTALIFWHLSGLKDAEGRTTIDGWEGQGFPDLKGDEITLVKGRGQARVSLLEVHRVIDSEQIEVVDLLQPGSAPFRLVDRSLAARAARFHNYLCLTYPLPFFRRIAGIGLLLPEIGQFEAAEIAGEIVKHLGGPVEREAKVQWMAEHFMRVHDAILATSQVRRQRMFAGMDAKFGKTVYELVCPYRELREALEGLEEIAADPLSDEEQNEGFSEAWAWFSDEPMHGHARPVLGRILGGQSHARLQTFGAARLAELRKKFESLLGEKVLFKGERIEDLMAKKIADEPAANMELVPPGCWNGPNK